MRILFVGTILPTEYENRVDELSSYNNRYVWNIIGGLESLGHEVYILSYLDFELPQLDLETLKKACASHGVEVYLEKEQGAFREAVRGYLKKVDSVLAFDVKSPWKKLGEMADDVKKKSAVIIPADAVAQKKESVFADIRLRQKKSLINWYDTVIGMSKNAQALSDKEQRFLLIEGGLNVADYTTMGMCKELQGMNYMYLGTLDEDSGIDIMLQAFHEYNDPSAVLYVAGKGDGVPKVIEYCTMDRRITYLDSMDRLEYKKLLNKCHAILVPRDMKRSANANFFPSRLTEYLASGRIIVSTKFCGFESFEGCCIFTESTVGGLKKGLKIAKAANEKLAVQIYENNRKRALNYDWKAQAAKIAGGLR